MTKDQHCHIFYCPKVNEEVNWFLPACTACRTECWRQDVGGDKKVPPCCKDEKELEEKWKKALFNDTEQN